jgi:uncharacterized protein (TIGR04255 family)
MSKRYINPPIIEALCEFQFIPSLEWDLTIPGLIYEKVKSEFPLRKQQIGIGVKFKPTEKGFEHKVEPAPPRIQFFKKDKKSLMQVACDFLAVNKLKPYQTWSKFRPMILQALEKYKEVAKPEGFKRIGLRYINKAEFPNKSFVLSKYFNFYPYIPKELPQRHKNFVSRVEISYKNNRDLLLITLGSTNPESPDKRAIILDLDYIMNNPEAVQINDCESWLDQAHLSVEKAFESCITDRIRNMLEEKR